MESTSAENLESSLATAFKRNGFDLFLVGGALRDELLGLTHEDLDFATSARPDQTAAILESLDGLSVFKIGAKYGTIGAVCDGRLAEITTYRSAESYPHGSRKPEVEFGSTIEEDLSRRDFSVNAIARTAHRSRNESAEFIDPFDGQGDIRRKIIRAVGEPARRFAEDPLRLLRGVRLAASLEFTIEPATWEAMKASPHLLRDISRERIADEFNRMLTGVNPTRAFELLLDSGMLAHSVPELLDLDALPDQGPYHQYSLWVHTFRVVEGVPADPVARWAALLHDIAKPETLFRDPDGRIRFFGHDEAGAEKAERILKSLRMSNEMVDSVRVLVATHMQMHQYRPDWSDGAVRRLYWKLGPNFERSIALARADARGHGDNPWSQSGADAFAERVPKALSELPRPSSPLNGAELMAHYGREAGPWIGEIKDTLTDMVTDGQLKAGDKNAAWREADRLALQRRD